MENNVFKEYIQSLEDKYKVNIKNNIVYFPYNSWVPKLIALIIAILAGFLYYYVFKDSITNYIHRGTVERRFHSDFFGIIIGFITYISFLTEIKTFKVIDFENNIIYNEFSIFGNSFKFNKIKKSSILQIANNSFPLKYDPSWFGKYNGKNAEINNITKLYHKYYISFLLKSGKILNFIELGINEEDYQTSLKLSQIISDYWNLEQINCPINYQLKSIGNYEHYKLEAKKIIIS